MDAEKQDAINVYAGLNFLCFLFLWYEKLYDFDLYLSTGSWDTFSHNQISQRYGNWVLISITTLQDFLPILYQRLQGIFSFLFNETLVEKFDTFYVSLEMLTFHFIAFRSTMKRSLSESSIISESSPAALGPVGRHGLAEKDEEVKGLSDSAPEISTSETAKIAASLR